MVDKAWQLEIQLEESDALVRPSSRELCFISLMTWTYVPHFSVSVNLLMALMLIPLPWLSALCVINQKNGPWIETNSNSSRGEAFASDNGLTPFAYVHNPYL
jgi:hypothetical protein